jgi:hypothetical protein
MQEVVVAVSIRQVPEVPVAQVAVVPEALQMVQMPL